MKDLNEMREQIRQFNLDRDWDKFHHPKDVLLALVGEVGELAECYQWLTDEQLNAIKADPEKKRKIEEELADVMMYLMILSYKTDVDLSKAVKEKLEKNKIKYPLDKSKGVHSNFIAGFKGD